ncbi:MAG: FAD-binding protein [Gemmatimonadales bacterium]
MTAVATDLNPVQELVLEAAASGTPIRIAGRCHWIDAGRPVNATRVASLAVHAGIVDYVPGDLTITVRSGTTLREIENLTRAEGQWLPLDPPGSSDGTIGATIATGSFGPLAHAFGRARDLVLGVEFVTGDGRAVRGGGRVVKNVAGFDLVRLVTGSWGTLGVITEVTLRLHSVPLQPATLSLAVPGGRNALMQRLTSILAAPATPLAVEIVDASLARSIGLPERQQILILLGGNPASVAAQRDVFSRLGGAESVDNEAWSRLRTVEDTSPPIVLRISALPARLAEIWDGAHASLAGGGGAMLHSMPSLGVIRCILPSGTTHQTVERLLSATPDATVVFERLPSAMWAAFSPSVVDDRLSRGIKLAFDPSNILNPGILGPTS